MDAVFVRMWLAESLGTLVGSVVGAIARMVADIQRRRRLVVAILIALLISSIGSNAQVTGDPMGSGVDQWSNASQPPKVASVQGTPFTATQAIEMIDKSVNTALSGLYSSTLFDYGDYIANSLVAFTMLWAAVKMLAAGKGLGDLFGEWVPIFVAYGVFFFLVHQHGAQDISRTFDVLIKTITHVDMSTLSLSLGEGVGQFWDAVTAVGKMPMALTLNHWWDLIYVLPDFLAWVITKFLAWGFIAIAAVIYMGIVAFAHIGVGVTTALAAIFVPFLIFRPTEFLFKGWLMSLLGANMIKLATAIMILVTKGVLSQLLVVANTVSQDAKLASDGGLDMFVTDLNMYIVMVMFALLAAVLMSQAPKIGMGLLSGSAGGFAFSGLGAAAQGAAKFNKAAAPVAQGSWNQTGGKWMAARQGKNDAKNGVPMAAGRYQSKAQHRAYVTAHAKNKPTKPEKQWGD